MSLEHTLSPTWDTVTKALPGQGGFWVCIRVPAPCPKRLPHTCVQKSRGGEMVGQASLLQSHGRTPDTEWTAVLPDPKRTWARRGPQAEPAPQACQPRDTHHDLRHHSSGLCTRAAAARRVLRAGSGHVKRRRSAQAHSTPERERGRPRQRARRLVARAPRRPQRRVAGGGRKGEHFLGFSRPAAEVKERAPPGNDAT